MFQVLLALLGILAISGVSSASSTGRMTLATMAACLVMPLLRNIIASFMLPAFFYVTQDGGFKECLLSHDSSSIKGGEMCLDVMTVTLALMLPAFLHGSGRPNKQTTPDCCNDRKVTNNQMPADNGSITLSSNGSQCKDMILNTVPTTGDRRVSTTPSINAQVDVGNALYFPPLPPKKTSLKFEKRRRAPKKTISSISIANYDTEIRQVAPGLSSTSRLAVTEAVRSTKVSLGSQKPVNTATTLHNSFQPGQSVGETSVQPDRIPKLTDMLAGLRIGTDLQRNKKVFWPFMGNCVAHINSKHVAIDRDIPKQTPSINRFADVLAVLGTDLRPTKYAYTPFSDSYTVITSKQEDEGEPRSPNLVQISTNTSVGDEWSSTTALTEITQAANIIEADITALSTDFEPESEPEKAVAGQPEDINGLGAWTQSSALTAAGDDAFSFVGDIPGTSHTVYEENDVNEPICCQQDGHAQLGASTYWSDLVLMDDTAAGTSTPHASTMDICRSENEHGCPMIAQPNAIDHLDVQSYWTSPTFDGPGLDDMVALHTPASDPFDLESRSNNGLRTYDFSSYLSTTLTDSELENYNARNATCDYCFEIVGRDYCFDGICYDCVQATMPSASINEAAAGNGMEIMQSLLCSICEQTKPIEGAEYGKCLDCISDGIAAIKEAMAFRQSGCLQHEPDLQPVPVSSKRSISETEDDTNVINKEEHNIDASADKSKRGRFDDDALSDTTATFVWDECDDRDPMYPDREYQPLEARTSAEAAKLVFSWIKHSERDIKDWESILDHFTDKYESDSSRVIAHFDTCLKQPQNLKDLKAVRARLEQINNYGTDGSYHRWDSTRVSDVMVIELRKSCGKLAEIAGQLTTYSEKHFSIFDDIEKAAKDFCIYTGKIAAVRDLERGAKTCGKRNREDSEE